MPPAHPALGHEHQRLAVLRPGIDSLVGRALAAGDAEAGPLWAEADRRVVDAAPIVPLVNRRNVLLVSDRVGNVQQHFQFGPLLDQFWVR